MFSKLIKPSLLAIMVLTLSWTALAVTIDPLIRVDEGYGVTPAPGWVVRGGESAGVAPSELALQSTLFPEQSEAIALLSVQVTDATNVTLRSWADEVHASLGGEAKGKMFVLDFNVQLDGHPACKILATSRTRLNGKIYEAGHFRIAVIDHGKLYVVHGVATQKNFDKHWADIKKMALSFHFTEPH